MEKLDEEKKLSLDEKIELNLPLNEEELKELNKRVEEREKKEAEERAKQEALIPKQVNKTWEEKVLDGEEELPKELKIINRKLERKTPEELYKDKLLSKEKYSNYQRNKRNNYLYETDKYLLIDFPISAEELKTVKSYREYLRNVPEDKKFPDIEIKTLEKFKNS